MAISTNGSSTLTTERWTAARVRELPDDGNTYEVIDGELLVSPAPARPHEGVFTRLMAEFSTYLKAIGRLDALVGSKGEVSWDSDTLVQPDLFVIHPDQANLPWKEVRTLLLVIEILSPSSRRADYELKRELYQRNGVKEYWIVDQGQSHVAVWRPDSNVATIAKETLVWHPDPALASPAHPTLQPLTLDLAELFRPLGAATA